MLERIRQFKPNKKFLYIAIILFVIALNIYGVRFGMDLIILTFCVVALFKGETVQFIKDWFPPMVLFYIYEATRARAYQVSSKLGIEPIVQPLIDVERKLFFFLDEVPPVKLQQAMRDDLYTAHWYDYILFFFYVMFFWYWLAIGFLLWSKRRDLFKPYIYGLVAFSMFDVFLYLVAPTAPPWWASDHGYLPEVHRILWQIKYLPSTSISVISTYGVNEFAALPSHHAAWPFYGSLFLIKVYGKKALVTLIVPFMIGFATWYGAEHYVIDTLAGFLIAGVAFLIATNVNTIKARLEATFSSSSDK